MRDLRDPQKLGEALLRDLAAVRHGYDEDAVPTQVYDLQTGSYVTPPYDDGGFISSNPADHHSKTPQDTNHQEG